MAVLSESPAAVSSDDGRPPPAAEWEGDPSAQSRNGPMRDAGLPDTPPVPPSK